MIRYFVDLATNLIARPTISITTRIAVLNYKVRYDAMKSNAIEIASFGQLNEVVNGERGVVREKLNCKTAHGGGHNDLHGSADARHCALVVCHCITSSHCANTRREIASTVCFQKCHSFSP